MGVKVAWSVIPHPTPYKPYTVREEQKKFPFLLNLVQTRKTDIKNNDFEQGRTVR